MQVLSTVVHDLRHAVRALRRAPLFTLAATLTLALGIGATTAVFSLINGLLLRPLPVPAADRLATISTALLTSQGRPAGMGWTYEIWERFSQQADVFDGAFAWMPRQLNLGRGVDARPAEAVVTTSGFFSTLGVEPLLGRTFVPDDDRRGGGPDGPVVVISYDFWQRDLDGAADVIGSSLAVVGAPFTVVGVTPPGFTGVEVGRRFDIALTFEAEPTLGSPAPIDVSNAVGLIPMIRLGPDQTFSEATAALRRVQPEVLRSDGASPFRSTPWVAVAAPAGTSAAGSGMSGLRQRYEQPLVIVLAIVGTLLFIACANLVNLLLVRADRRRAELSVRLALGASRARLVGQLLVENLVLGVLGAVGGGLVALWTTGVLVAQVSTLRAPVALDVSFDWRVLAFLAGITTLAVLVFGVMPAARAARQAPMAVGWRSAGRVWAGPSSAVVIGQVALSLVLLAAAGLFVGTLLRLGAAPLGMDREAVLLVPVDTKQAAVGSGGRGALYQRLVDAVGRVPGVEVAAASTSVPLDGGGTRVEASPVGGVDVAVRVPLNHITPSWFGAMGIPLLAGRDFEADDSAGAGPVVVVNQTLARQLFPDGDPLGRLIAAGPPGWPDRTVVGVVGDSVTTVFRDNRPSAPLRGPIMPAMFVPLAQMPEGPPSRREEVTIALRATSGAPANLAGGIGARLGAVDPQLVYRFRPLDDVVEAAVAQERLTGLLGGAFGLLGLGLVGVGLFGVSAYTVAARRREIGVRMALGATPGAVVRQVLRRVVALVGIGLVEGVILSVLVLPFVSALLFGVQPHDPASLTGASTLLLAVGLLAGAIPAWRAVRVEPAIVLREH